MPEQVLSQEEIDALLTSMDSGELNLEEVKKEEPEFEPYDLSSQSIILRDQFYALEEIYDKFAGLLNTSLSSSLQNGIEAEFVSTEMVKFGEFLKAFPKPTSFNMFGMEPLIGAALMAIEANLVFCLIDCMFGGNGKPLNKVREFTLIEQRMITKFAVVVLKDLEKAWQDVHPLKISLKKTETKPEFVHLVAPDDLVIIVVFSVKGDELSGNIHLCIPFLMLEPIKDKLSSRSLRHVDTENTWGAQLQNLLKEIPVKLAAELGRTTSQTVGDLLNLRAGNIFKINTGPQDPVVVTVEDVPKYQGLPGVVKGSRAVQIISLLRRNGGSDDHGYA
ncbi:MAG: flagellar motor switch protein FliM [Thermodesulfobacteriota bacterium]|nr:flagellar motor switch protein FliM [Thermodesulfobacteriota bacterium]